MDAILAPPQTAVEKSRGQRFVAFDPVASAGLRGIPCLVGFAHALWESVEARCFFIEHVAQALQHIGCGFGVRRQQQHAEFFAAKPAYRVARPGILFSRMINAVQNAFSRRAVGDGESNRRSDR